MDVHCYSLSTFLYFENFQNWEKILATMKNLTTSWPGTPSHQN